MTSFTAESFKGKLSKLNDSQQSIQTLSHWVQYHKKSCDESASVWATEALRAKPDRQLIFVYLANDIMQNSRRKGPEFVKSYGAQLVHVLPAIFGHASQSVQAKLLRMLSIWEERRVLSDAMHTEMRNALSGGGAVHLPKPPPAHPPTAALAAAAAASRQAAAEAELSEDEDAYVPEPMPSAAPAASSGAVGGGMALADLLVTLDQGSLADELQAEREADLDMRALEEIEVSDPSELEAAGAKARAAVALLTAQKAKLVDELKARRQLIVLLAGSVQRQHEQCTRLDEALRGCEAMLGTASQAEEQVATMAEQMASISAMASEQL